MNLIFFISFILLFLPVPVFADVITRQSEVFFDASYLLPLIIIVETLALWLIAKYIVKKKIGLARCLLAISIANIFSALLGFFIPLGRGESVPYFLLIISYPLSSIIEAPIMKALIKDKSYTWKRIFIICFLVNLFSYGPLAIWMFLT